MRAAVSEKTERVNGIRSDPETEVTITCGVSEGVVAAVLALTEPGDEAIILEPWYENYVPACVLAGVWLLWRIMHAPFGRALQAGRDNEQRAPSPGFNVYLLRLGAFVLMAGFVGFAGALVTFLLQGVYANNLSWQHAGDALLMTVLGGVHHFLGPLWGAISFIILENRLSAITVSHPAIVVFTRVADIVAIFALGGAASSSILSVGRASRDQNEPKCKSR